MISSSRVPLHRHDWLRTSDAEHFRSQLNTHLRVRCTFDGPTEKFEATARRFALPSGELWFTSTRTPLTLYVPDAPFFRIQERRAGAGVTVVGRQAVAVGATQSCISPSEAALQFGPGFQQLVWRVRHDVLTRKLVALTGTAVTRKLIFEPVLSRRTPQARALFSVLRCLQENIDVACLDSPPAALAELEQALMVSLLRNCSHNHRALFYRQPPAAGSWAVRRVEDYIAAHWNRAIQIEELARITGSSARSLYRAFRRTRGYSPLEFVRQQRLQNARRLLEDPIGDKTVTAIAFGCGFNDVSHFSREFSKAFGETPSAVIGRQRRSRLCAESG